MKKQVSVLAFALLMMCFTKTSFGQTASIESLLNKAVSLSQQGGNTGEVANLLSLGTKALAGEAAATGSSPLAGKLLSQVGILQTLIPLATQGGLKTDAISKVVSTVELLVGANRINSIIGGGKSNILSNAAALTSNLGLLKSAGSILGGSSAGVLGSLIDGATSSIGKFGNKGFLGIGGANCAAGSAGKQLGKIVELVGSTIK